ncbi:MAG TPA: DUF1987 domain-containing protein, partial [Bacteroidales bacterium]
MNDLLLKPDFQGKTPLIDFKVSGVLNIEGRSILENIIDHFQPAVDWINNLSTCPPPTITLNIKLEYFNTRSSKMILNILKSLEGMHLSKKSKVTVNWYYGDDDLDMLEAGNDYQSIIKLPFNMIS